MDSSVPIGRVRSLVDRFESMQPRRDDEPAAQAAPAAQAVPVEPAAPIEAEPAEHAEQAASNHRRNATKMAVANLAVRARLAANVEDVILQDIDAVIDRASQMYMPVRRTSVQEIDAMIREEMRKLGLV